MIGRAIDKMIGVFAPAWGAQRLAARATLDQMASYGASGSNGGYAAGKLNRLNFATANSPLKENAQPSADIERIRWQAWDLWRNNAYARKIVRSITSKVIGPGMTPQSCANLKDGSANTAFRERAAQLWKSIQHNFDFRGRPGMGGLDTVQMAKTALRSVVIGGECLWQLRAISLEEMEARGLPVPYTLQLVDAERLGNNMQPSMETELPNGNRVYRGIEIDKDGRRVAYHLYSFPLGALTPTQADSQRIDADQMGHLFVEDDIDQMRGVSWFAAALLDARDVQDYRYNELKSSAMAACVVLGYSRPTGSTQLGLNTPATQSNTDTDGNVVNRMQPGMVVDLGQNGKLEGFNPGRDSAGVEGFAQFMVRGIAASMPGTKASTVTGDYRNSSFSSEKAADNDCWPEMQEVQDWFASSFYQPIWERILSAAVMVGYFDGIITAQEFNADRQCYCAATWQGPISKSINPTDDAKSASLRVQGLLSSLQDEAAAINKDWRQNLAAMAEVYKLADTLGCPKDVIDQLYGIQVTESAMADPGENDPENTAEETGEPEHDSDMPDDSNDAETGMKTPSKPAKNTPKGAKNVVEAA